MSDMERPLLARTGPLAMSAVRSLSGSKQTWRGQPISVAFDPGCVKTQKSKREENDIFQFDFRQTYAISDLISAFAGEADYGCQPNFRLHRRANQWFLFARPVAEQIGL
jgi:hypothetical protein